jgi:iron complex outermembrane receptor protein
MKKKLTSVIFFMAWLCALFAQAQNYTLSGVVKDAESSQLLSGAHVQIVGTFLAAITNSQGQFEFKNLKQGNYDLRVSYVGFKTNEMNVKIDRDIKIEIAIEQYAITTEEIIIKANRADEKTPSTNQVITGKQINQINMGQDLPMLLDLTPSLVTTSDAGSGIGYTGLRIRGTDINRINVTINGVPLNDPESHSVYWVDMPDLASSIDNIQIQRGVGTSANGASAFGASINVQTTKISSDPFAEINTNYGSFNSLSNKINFGSGLINGKWTFDGRFSNIKSDGYIDRAFSDLKSQFINAGYYGEKSILRFTMLMGEEVTYQAWGGVPKDSLKTNRTFNPYTYDNETDNYSQDHYHLNFLHQFNNKLSFNATGFIIRGKGYYEQYKDEREFSDYNLSSIIIGNDTITESDIIQQKHLDNIFYGINIGSNYKPNNFLDITGGLSVNNYEGNHFGKIIWMEYSDEVEKD